MFQLRITPFARVIGISMPNSVAAPARPNSFGPLTNKKPGLKPTVFGSIHTRHCAATAAPNAATKPGTLGIGTRAQGDRVVVASVLAGLPAYEGGVNTGDELVAIDGRKIDANSVNSVMAELQTGQKVALLVFRRERLMTFDLTAAIRPFDRYTISEMKDATDAQKELRKGWLNEK